MTKFYNYIIAKLARTHSVRHCWPLGRLMSITFLPVTSSTNTTPKEYTSAFSVIWPLWAYSGAKYLHSAMVSFIIVCKKHNQEENNCCLVLPKCSNYSCVHPHVSIWLPPCQSKISHLQSTYSSQLAHVLLTHKQLKAHRWQLIIWDRRHNTHQGKYTAGMGIFRSFLLKRFQEHDILMVQNHGWEGCC
jgi:hypothetical protein